MFRPAPAVFALFLGFAVAIPTTTTNAARFKQAPGPLKPDNIFGEGSTVVERGGFTRIRWDGKEPTKRQGGSDPLSSSTPAVKAMIRAYDMSNPSNPLLLGYVTPVPIVNSGLFSYTQDPTDAVVVTAQIADLQPGNIEFESPPFNGYPNLGFSCAADYSELRPGLSNICYLVGSTAVPEHSPPLSTPDQSFTNGSLSEPTESTVWYLVDFATLEIAPQWINSDGTKPETYPAYFTNLSYFVITGDRGAVASDFGEYGQNIPIVSMQSLGTHAGSTLTLGVPP
ncbi:hypothetical protein FS837_011904 [Tulasnella sp. UAMH 9824]|nr:hypothetical protein FS837_011904 [Tulasnella sp. UAMH 9824]